ncbi:hypothetical protein HK101_005562 [Irineochytrium annulatum]|nr:hypothetical protein HK101_005562 [Irineochytrium annulatum]
MQFRSILVVLAVLLTFLINAVAADPAQDSLVFRKYIIVFKDGADESDQQPVVSKIKEFGGRVKDTYSIISAISAELPTKFVKALEQMSIVDYIEEDGPVYTFGDAASF